MCLRTGEAEQWDESKLQWCKNALVHSFMCSLFSVCEVLWFLRPPAQSYDSQRSVSWQGVTNQPALSSLLQNHAVSLGEFFSFLFTTMYPSSLLLNTWQTVMWSILNNYKQDQLIFTAASFLQQSVSWDDNIRECVRCRFVSYLVWPWCHFLPLDTVVHLYERYSQNSPVFVHFIRGKLEVRAADVAHRFLLHCWVN